MQSKVFLEVKALSKHKPKHHYQKSKLRREEKMKKLMAFFKEEDGAALIEYVLLAALIAVVAIGAMTAVGDNSITTLNGAATAMVGS